MNTGFVLGLHSRAGQWNFVVPREESPKFRPRHRLPCFQYSLRTPVVAYIRFHNRMFLLKCAR